MDGYVICQTAHIATIEPKAPLNNAEPHFRGGSSHRRRQCLLALALLSTSLLSDAQERRSVLELHAVTEPPESVLDIQRCTNLGSSSESNSACSGTLTEIAKVLRSLSLKRQLPSLGVVKVRVSLQAGNHRLTRPIDIHWGRDLTHGISLEIAGQSSPDSNKPTATVSGAQSISHLMRPNLNPESHPKSEELVAFDVSSFGPFNIRPDRGFGMPIRPMPIEVFWDDKILPIASWPNNTYSTIRSGAAIENKQLFLIEGKHSSQFRNEPELLVSAYWYHDWAYQVLGVQAAEAGSFRFVRRNPAYGIRTGQRVRIENAFSELDVHGEWYLNRASGVLYVWEPERSTGKRLEVAVAESLLRVSDSVGVSIRNIIFERSRGDAIRILGSRNVTLDSVIIRQTGNRALVVNGGAGCGIRNSVIEDNGDGGVSIEGGNRQSLEKGGHFVEHTRVRRFSRLSKTYRPGVELEGVGLQIVGSEISDAPHIGIEFRGNDHRILGNTIFDVAKETSDSGAIYTGRELAGRGTRIEENFIRDIKPYSSSSEVKGVFLDDQASGIVVRRNIFARVQQPVFIGGGRDNLIVENLFYNSSPAIHLDARGLTWQRSATIDPKGPFRKHLDAVPFAGPIYSARYANLANLLDDEFGAPKYNIARRNVVVGGNPIRLEGKAKDGIDFGEFILGTESDFLNRVPASGRVERFDFRLKAGILDLPHGVSGIRESR